MPASPIPPPLTTEAIATLPPAERRSEASRACRARRAELALFVDLVRERDGTVLDLERVCLDDEVMVALLALAQP